MTYDAIQFVPNHIRKIKNIKHEFNLAMNHL